MWNEGKSMNCRKCKKNIPEDSAFCPYCGEEVIPDNVCLNCRHEMPEDSVFCPFCGTQIISQEAQDPKNVSVSPSVNNLKLETDSNEFGETIKKAKKNYMIAVAIVAALAVIMGILMISQTVRNNNLRQSLDAEIGELKTENAELSAEITELKKTDNNESNNTLYDSIINNLKSFSFISSSERYYSDKQIVYLSQSKSQVRAFNVTCTFNTTCHVENTASNGSGQIECYWGDFTGDRSAFYITPKEKGVYRLHFTTNSYDAFNVLVIVD